MTNTGKKATPGKGAQHKIRAEGEKGEVRARRLRQALAAFEGTRGRGRAGPFAAYRGREQNVEYIKKHKLQNEANKREFSPMKSWPRCSARTK